MQLNNDTVMNKPLKQQVHHTLQIGQYYAGGIIFYLDSTYQHGLVCTASNQGAAQWECTVSGTSFSFVTDSDLNKYMSFLIFRLNSLDF